MLSKERKHIKLKHRDTKISLKVFRNLEIKVVRTEMFQSQKMAG